MHTRIPLDGDYFAIPETFHGDTRPVVLETRVVVGPGGGPEKTILNTPRWIEPLGYPTICVYMHPPGDAGRAVLARRAEELGAPLIALEDRGPFDWRIVKKLLHICRTLRVRVWHSHDYKSNVLGLVLARFWPMRLITTAHGWGNLVGYMPLYTQIDKWAIRFYEQVVCVSPDLWATCRKLNRNTHYLPNGIDVARFRRRQERHQARSIFKLPADALVLGSVGRLADEKRFDWLLRSVKLLVERGHNAWGLVVGEGPERIGLEHLAGRLGIHDRFKLVGFLEDVRPAYEAMDIFCSTSVREGVPNVVLEAMAYELPIVATALPGTKQLIEDCQNGLLAPVDDEKAYHQAVLSLINDREGACRLGQAARFTVETRFSFAERIQKMAAIYTELLATR